MKKVLTFATLEHVEGFTYRWHDDVRLVMVEGEEYVRIDEQGSKRDYLRNLSSLTWSLGL